MLILRKFNLSKEKFLVFSILSLFVIGFSIGDSYGAIYLQIPGIQGDSVEPKHKDWINLLSVNLEESQRDSPQPISFVKQLDSSSALLTESATTGKVHPLVTLHVCSVDRDQECVEYQFTDVSFVGYFVTVKGDSYPTEEISFVYSEIKESSKEGLDNETPDARDPTTNLEVIPQRVPDWVEKTASFWIAGDVSDREFTDGIGYLVKEGIIELDEKVESLTEDTPADPHVPEWIKEAVNWWINDLVPEDQFLEAIKWLIKNGIIQGVPTE